MIRKAFVMSVNEGQEAEYERRHRPIWAELEATLKAHGAHNYSIFLHPETRQLFGYVEIEDGYPERPDEGDQASEGHEAELAEHALEILLEDQLQRDAQRAGLEPDPGEEWRRRWRAGERAMIERLRDEGDLESFAKALVQREFKVRLVRREDE